MSVLVVDNDLAARRRTVRLLQGLGHEVVEAPDWEQALQRAREQEPQLVLLAMSMPGHDGRWIAARLEQMQLQTRVVFVIDPDTYALDASKQGSFDYLLKPLQREALQALFDPDAGTSTQYQTREPRQLALKDIWFFRLEGELIVAFDGLQEYPVESSVQELQQVHGKYLVRIHHDYLVDCHRIERLERDKQGRAHLWLRGYTKPLPVSPHLESRVRASMNC